MDTEGNNRDRVQIGFGSPTSFGRKRIGKAADWLTDIVFPAGSQEGAQQREPQVGGDVGDRIAHLLLGEEDKPGFEDHTCDDNQAQQADTRLESKGGECITAELFQAG